MARNVNWNRNFGGIRNHIWSQQMDIAKKQAEVDFLKWRRERNWKIAAGVAAAALIAAPIVGGALAAKGGAAAAAKAGGAAAGKAAGAAKGGKLGAALTKAGATGSKTNAGKLLQLGGQKLGIGKGPGFNPHLSGTSFAKYKEMGGTLSKAAFKDLGGGTFMGRGLSAYGKVFGNYFGIKKPEDIFSQKGIQGAVHGLDLLSSESPEEAIGKMVSFQRNKVEQAQKNALLSAKFTDGINIPTNNISNIGGTGKSGSKSNKNNSPGVVIPGLTNSNNSIIGQMKGIKNNIAQSIINNPENAIQIKNEGIAQLNQLGQLRNALNQNANAFTQIQNNGGISNGTSIDTLALLQSTANDRVIYNPKTNLLDVYGDDGKIMESLGAEEYIDISSKLIRKVENPLAKIDEFAKAEAKEGNVTYNENLKDIYEANNSQLWDVKGNRISLATDWYKDDLNNLTSNDAEELYSFNMSDEDAVAFDNGTISERANILENYSTQDGGTILRSFVKEKNTNQLESKWNNVIDRQYVLKSQRDEFTTAKARNEYNNSLNDTFKNDAYDALTEFSEGGGINPSLFTALGNKTNKLGIEGIIPKKSGDEIVPFLKMHNGAQYPLTGDAKQDIGIIGRAVGLDENKVKTILSKFKEPEKGPEEDISTETPREQSWGEWLRSLVGIEPTPQFDFSGLD